MNYEERYKRILSALVYRALHLKKGNPNGL